MKPKTTATRRYPSLQHIPHASIETGSSQISTPTILSTTSNYTITLEAITRGNTPKGRKSGLMIDSLCVKTEAKKRYSMRKIGDREGLCSFMLEKQCDLKPTTSIHKSRKSDIPKSTESELDKLIAAAKPKKPRLSDSYLPSSTTLPHSPSPTRETRNFRLLPWVEKPQPIQRKSPLKLFINLPKLPFGSHKSYNEEKDIRSLIVTKRWKAWKRERKVRLDWSYDEDFHRSLNNSP